MSGEIDAFVDTNVLVYAVSDDEPLKQTVAADLVRQGFLDGGFAISSQVMLELYVNLRRKLAEPMPEDRALQYVLAFRRWRVIEATADLVESSLRLAERFQISVWDACILEAARLAGCRRLLTEDLSHGRDYAGVVVENPFR